MVDREEPGHLRVGAENPSFSAEDAPKRLVIASRESRLAMWQAEHVQRRLRECYPHCEVPILGMERHFPADLARLRSVKVFAAPGGDTASTTHGGFDDDAATMASVIAGMGK